MNILVTGGAGYKGIILTRKLLKLGHHVTVLDNFMYGFDCILHLAQEKNLTVIKQDIRNLDTSLVPKYDTVVHLAGVSGMPACAANPHSAEMINVDSTRKLVSALGKEQLLLYASTTSFYGAAEEECTEDIEVHPVSLYGRTKHEAELISMEHANSISLRFATIFGTSPKMRVDLMVNDFAYKAVNDRSVVLFASRSKRTFVHLEDAIEGYLFALENRDKMAGQVYNVGDQDMNFSKLEIAEAIKKHVDFEIIDSTLPDLDTRNFYVSFKKLNALGYKANRTLEEGINELLKLYEYYKIYSPYNLI